MATAPPADGDMATTIKKLAEYVHKNGGSFETMMKEKQQANPKFTFLFGGEGYEYYRWMKHCAANNWNEGQINSQLAASQGQGQGQGIAQVQAMPAAAAGPHHAHLQPAAAPGPAGGAMPFGMSEQVSAELEKLLADLGGSKDHIKGGKNWIFTQWRCNDAVMKRMLAFARDESNFDKKLYMVYVLNDVLHQCKAKHQASGEGGESAAQILKATCMYLPLFMRYTLNTAGAGEAQKGRILKVLKLWGERQILDAAYVATVETAATSDAINVQVAPTHDAPAMRSRRDHHSGEVR
jgi:hypothetical protein